MNIDLMYTILFSAALMLIIAIAYILNKTRGVQEHVQVKELPTEKQIVND